MPSLKFKNPETGEFEKLRGQKPGMLPSVYDPQGKKTDIFKYVDDKAGEGANIAIGPDAPTDANVWIDTSEELTGVVAGMLSAVYDPQGKKTDIFKYVDDALAGFTGGSGVEIGADEPVEGDVWIDTDDVYSDTVSSALLVFADGETLQQKYDDGELNGPAGSDGKNGADGYTPVKGTDYWTEEDKAEIVEDVLAVLPTAEGASF